MHQKYKCDSSCLTSKASTTTANETEVRGPGYSTGSYYERQGIITTSDEFGRVYV